MTNADVVSAVIKASKKVLKKNGGTDASMQLADLAKKVASKKKMTYERVVEYIQKETKKFSVDGNNVVSLIKKNKKKDSSSKKRKQRDEEDVEATKTTSNKKIKEEEDDDDEKKENGEKGGDDKDAISSWRKDNKIILAPSSSSGAADEERQIRELNGKESFFPLKTFDAASEGVVAPPLIRHCTSLGFERPSPIQAQAWPILALGRDVVGIAETGSGKTLAFCLPALTKMMSSGQKQKKKKERYNPGRQQPQMLILSPTRELAMQIDKVLQEFGAVVGIRSIVLYGGVPKYQQVTQLKRGGIDCVVATPGRLKDLIQENSVRLDAVQHLVLDEADRMLDLGFEQDVRDIISTCKSREEGRQTAMFSATWPAAIQEIASEYMTDPVRVYVGFEAITSRDISDDDDSSGGADGGKRKKTTSIVAVDDSLSANKRVQQNVEVIEDARRPSRLRELLRQVHRSSKNGNNGGNKDRVLVFALYKKEAERLEFSLQRDGWDCCSIHGNKHQAQRTQALEQFKDGSCPLLIATDVAARGLDIPNVEVVINYTFPLTIEDYVHRYASEELIDEISLARLK